MNFRNFFLVLLCSCSSSTWAQDTLLLFHPTAYNIDVIERLSHEGILNLQDYHVMGVYHSGEAYDYDQAALKVAENPDGIFSLM